MVDDETFPDIIRRDLVLQVTCVNCVFYKRLAVMKSPCAELGTAPAAKTCYRFVPDPVQMDSPDRLARALTAIAGARRPLLAAAAAAGSRRIAKLGYALGQRVIFRIMGGDYLSNYASAIVVGATRTQLVLSGIDSFTAMVNISSVLDKEGFERKRTSLVRRNRINDPATPFERIRVNNKDKLLLHMPTVAGVKKKRGRPPAKKKKIDFDEPIVLGTH